MIHIYIYIEREREESNPIKGVANMLDCNTGIKKFKLQLHY